MSDRREQFRSLSLAVLMVLSVVAGAVAFSGSAAAATSVSISPDNDDAGASSVTYTATGTVEVNDTLQYVDVHLSPADASNVGDDDVSLYIDGVEYTDGWGQFDSSGGTVEFKLANSQNIDAGDTVKVVVADVTNPSDDFTGEVTLHDTGDAKWSTFRDTVAIDTPANISYSSLSVDDTSVTTGEDVSVSATVENTGEQSGTYNVSLKVDGSVVDYKTGTIAGGSSKTVSFTQSFSSTGDYDVTIESLSAKTVTVSGPLAVTDGSASPSEVATGETVTNQQVSFSVDGISADGDTDWYYVEFPDALASGLSVNSVSANATSITSSPNLVDGYDGDGVDDTVKFATSADGSGEVALELTADVSVDYPDTEATYGVDVRVEDSSGETVTPADVATITSKTSNYVRDFSVSSSGGTDVAVSFAASEELGSITVDITSESGATVATLTEADFTGSEGGGTWTYEATTSVPSDGSYTATLTDATTADGEAVSTDDSDTVTVETTSASIEDGYANPNQVTPGETVNNQNVSIVLSGISADGDSDWHYVEFPDALASGLSVNSVSANATSITSSPTLVDGYDSDGVDDTVEFATSADGGGSIALELTTDVSVDYPSAAATYRIDTRVVDSQFGTATRSDVVSIVASNTSDDNETRSSMPSVAAFDVVADGQDVDVTVAMSSPVDQLRVDVDGTVDADLTRSEFTESQQNGWYVYSANISEDTAGTFTATLVTAANESGDAASNQTDSVTVELPDVVETGAVASPPWVGDGASTHTLTVTVPSAASVANETLSSVTVGYSEAFLNASGSVTSVSDDQNVVALTVISANGTVKSQMGETDAVSVNVVSGEVRLDLSDVDSSRKPTLASGDRVRVSIQPVTNPATAGQYQTDIALHSAGGHTTEVNASVQIRTKPAADAVDTVTVGPSDERVTLDLGNSSVVQSLTIGSDVNSSGVVSVSVPAERPAVAADAPGSVVTTFNISRPDAVENQSTTLRLTLSTDEIESNASNIVISRYDAESDSWVQLDTSVVSSASGSVTLEANTSQTSLFAVSSVDDSDDQQQTDDSTPTPTQTDSSGATETTETAGDSGPGFGIAVAVLALLGAALLALRRRD